MTHFEIWNEPDDTNFWQPTNPDGAEYGRLVKITGDAIRSVIPDAKIGACSSRSKAEFLRPLFDTATPDGLDFFCSHNYDRQLEFGEKSANYCVTHELIKSHGMTKTEFWMGECGHASWHPEGHWLYPLGGGSEHRQAVWYLRRALYDLRQNLRLTCFYIIADPWEQAYVTAKTNERKHPAYGVLNGLTYTPKLAYKSLSCLATLLGGDMLPTLSKLPVTLAVPLTSDMPCPISVDLINDGNEVFTYWLPFAIEEERGITGKCTATFDKESKIAEPIIIDMLDGSIYTPEAKDWDSDTKTLKNLPIGEYPFAVCDKAAIEII